MASPAPALLQLRRQIDQRWPGRSRASDGIMGDASHRRRRSAHNEGNAFDVSRSANGPNLHALTDDLRRQMAANPNGRLRGVIFDRQVCGYIRGWKWRPYRGPNPHTTHAHIEVKPSHRAITRPWSLRG